jgi:hypothetical protein
MSRGRDPVETLLIPRALFRLALPVKDNAAASFDNP